MVRAAVLAMLVLLAACQGEDGDYLVVTGGGFIFNYRLAEASYGLVAEPRRELPEGAVLVAEFEDPSGGPAIVVRHNVRPGHRRFSLETPPVHGVVKDREYHAILRLELPEGNVIETHERTFRSNLDQSILPDAPLTIGPGYQRPPQP